MEKHCKQQIAARSVDKVSKQHLIAKSERLLDMLMDLDQEPEKGQVVLKRLVEARCRAVCR